jgi:hypothetical protein
MCAPSVKYPFKLCLMITSASSADLKHFQLTLLLYQFSFLNRNNSRSCVFHSSVLEMVVIFTHRLLTMHDILNCGNLTPSVGTWRPILSIALWDISQVFQYWLFLGKPFESTESLFGREDPQQLFLSSCNIVWVFFVVCFAVHTHTHTHTFHKSNMC